LACLRISVKGELRLDGFASLFDVVLWSKVRADLWL